MVTTSATLLGRLRRLNQAADWQRFVQLYTPLVFVWAKRQCFQDADAQDLVQEVLVKLIRALPSYEAREGQSFRGWLFRVAVTQCRDFRRRIATRPMPGAAGLSAVADDTPVPEMEETEYRRLVVRRAMETIRADFNDTTWAAFA
jgi:RNA polymerase sigma-70 factor, ECF subfamily